MVAPTLNSLVMGMMVWRNQRLARDRSLAMLYSLTRVGRDFKMGMIIQK